MEELPMRLRSFLGSATLVALLAGACGTGSKQGFPAAGGDGGSGSGSDGGPADGNVPTFGDSGQDGSSGPTLACSGDLQSVVNSSGVVVQSCPPDQGCAGGQCVPACQAAAANKGTIGCDFVVATPSFDRAEVPPCFAIFVANSWGKAVTVQVTRGGMSYDATTFGVIPVAGAAPTTWSNVSASGIPPGQVGILFMSHDPSAVVKCPSPPAVSAAGGTAVYTGAEAATGTGTAWHLTTDVPVTAYDILPYGGAISHLPSAELLIPTTAWTTNYYGIVPYRGNADTLAPGYGAQWGQIVASQDGTVVMVVPDVTLPAGPMVATAPAGTITTYTLNAGDYVQWQDSMEMSNTVISSNNPIGFNGGLGLDCYASATSTGGGCDSAHQQIPPIGALGNDYVAPPFATRMLSMAPESIPYRIVGAVGGTTLTYDPPGIAATASTLYAAAPITLSAGEVVDFETTLAFRVTSQDANHPFYLGQIMPGCDVKGGSRPGCTGGGGGCCLGDEEFVNILPPAQFLQKYVFFTDLTYATTNLVFTRVKTASGFQDVMLDCAGTLGGWQPVGTQGLYEVTNVDLVRAGAPNGSCNNGPHMASSPGPFGLMVWGIDTFASYAYPAGGNVSTINTVVVPPAAQ
jgi:hypothetical protein